MTETHWEMDKSEENRMEKNKNSGAALARKMAVSLVCGLAAGFALNDETHVPRSMRYMVVNDSFGCVPPCCAVRE